MAKIHTRSAWYIRLYKSLPTAIQPWYCLDIPVAYSDTSVNCEFRLKFGWDWEYVKGQQK